MQLMQTLHLQLVIPRRITAKKTCSLAKRIQKKTFFFIFVHRIDQTKIRITSDKGIQNNS